MGSMAFSRFIKKPPPTASAAEEGYVYKDGGMFRKGWEAFQDLLRKEGSVVGEVAKSVVGDKKRKRLDTSGLERSTTTVTATSDVSRLSSRRCLHVCMVLPPTYVKGVCAVNHHPWAL